MDIFEENKLRTAIAEEARENARLASAKALDLARQCRAPKKEVLDKMTEAEKDSLKREQETIREKARIEGKRAWEVRKTAKEKAAESAAARRIACFKAMPPKPEPPPLVRPLKPPMPPKTEEEKDDEN